MKLIDILATYKAIKNTSKKYHWKSVGPQFMSDHLLFDRVVEYIDEDLIDTIVEEYYMGIGRIDIDDLNDLNLKAAQYEGKSYPSKAEYMDIMFKELATMMNNFLLNIENFKSLRGISSEIDDVADSVTHAYGLVLARLA